jgi:serine/threonine protein kinase
LFTATSSPETVPFIVNSPKLIPLVLFSLRDHRWKLADFGTASQATSKGLNTTRLSRGTSSYRAPEILREDARYNNKADIFALGCIIYEIVTCRKLFASDFAVWEYAMKKDPLLPRIWPDCVIGSPFHVLGRLADELVEIEVSKRPGATEVARKLEMIKVTDLRENQSLDLPKDLEGNVLETTDGIASLAAAGDEATQPFKAVFIPLYANSSGTGIEATT